MPVNVQLTPYLEERKLRKKAADGDEEAKRLLKDPSGSEEEDKVPRSALILVISPIFADVLPVESHFSSAQVFV